MSHLKISSIGRRSLRSSYALVATATDYDSWRPHEASVTAADVFRVLQTNAETSRFVAAHLLEDLAAAAAQGDILNEERGSMRFSIMPRSEKQKPEDREKLRFVLPDYFSN
jgi:5'-methylthioadenosine phosphorylase